LVINLSFKIRQDAKSLNSGVDPKVLGGDRSMNPEQKTRTNVKQAVPFFFVSNMEESVRFYVDGLGFKITKQWIVEDKLRWC
jgi:hypothetical protein